MRIFSNYTFVGVTRAANNINIDNRAHHPIFYYRIMNSNEFNILYYIYFFSFHQIIPRSAAIYDLKIYYANRR